MRRCCETAMSNAKAPVWRTPSVVRVPTYSTPQAADSESDEQHHPVRPEIQAARERPMTHVGHGLVRISG